MALSSGPPLVLVGAADERGATAIDEDLRALRYEVARLRLDRPSEHPPASLAVLATPGAMVECARASEEIRRSAEGGVPILWVVDPPDLAALERHEGLFDDFVRLPYTSPELDARLRRLHRAADAEGERLRVGRLEIDAARYRASVDGRPLKLTYMEFELLRYLAARPGRIHTREAILRGVWGYDYYGGMRTVDVHVRRLRAKLGQEHARMIETVRGVGYGLADRA